ncbi:hypothetical protein [Microbacterium sp. W4I20]|uniref:phage tail tube protein n=1 Tax=Microbacterium sp. W4I20 TaxID=3042262 RepID=UPI00277FF128|nr:hypothetical protein [Microbacterium sp. W4I20]MDQ0726809.1 hypothetical protein [Microbacterium sp. W4I20]
MAAETVPTSSQSDGRWRILQVPVGSNAKSVAILNGGTTKALTYGMTADGWDRQISQANVEDKRLTLIQDLSRPGKVTETVNIKVVVSSDVASADAILKALSAAGTESQYVQRQGVANDANYATGQVVDVLTGVLGVRRPDAPVENGVDTAQYTLYLTKPTERDAVLVA